MYPFLCVVDSSCASTASTYGQFLQSGRLVQKWGARTQISPNGRETINQTSKNSVKRGTVKAFTRDPESYRYSIYFRRLRSQDAIRSSSPFNLANSPNTRRLTNPPELSMFFLPLQAPHTASPHCIPFQSPKSTTQKSRATVLTNRAQDPTAALNLLSANKTLTAGHVRRKSQAVILPEPPKFDNLGRRIVGAPSISTSTHTDALACLSSVNGTVNGTGDISEVRAPGVEGDDEVVSLLFVDC